MLDRAMLDNPRNRTEVFAQTQFGKPCRVMNKLNVGSTALRGVVASALMIFSAPAEDTQIGPASQSASTTNEIVRAQPVKSESGFTTATSATAEKHSAGIGDILRMAHAGVSTDVIMVYVENSPIAYTLNASDVIALKEHAVPDEVTKALVKRGADLKTQVRRLLEEKGTRLAYVLGAQRKGGFDPESYDYFQYYYLYPRTLAFANQRMFAPYGSSAGAPSFGYGYYGPLPFRPLPPSVFRGQ